MWLMAAISVAPRPRANLIKNTVRGGSHTEVENRIIILEEEKKSQCRQRD